MPSFESALSGRHYQRMILSVASASSRLLNRSPARFFPGIPLVPADFRPSCRAQYLAFGRKQIPQHLALGFISGSPQLLLEPLDV
jgi:hypothetical protein